jgi:enoyl-CoA hydratase
VGARLDVDDDVATVTIDNPPLNLLSNAVRAELLARFEVAAAEGRVRVVVITGAGPRGFSAGSDVREFVEERGSGGAERAEREFEFLKRVASCPKPTIAAIEGYALGGGCELAMACDFRVASEDAQLGFPEIKLGVFPINTVDRSVLLLGEARTKELMFFGNAIGAGEAARIGLVHRVVAKGQVLTVAREMAQRLGRLPGATLAELKGLINRHYLESLEEGGRFARDAAARVFRTEDLREGVAAFLEKRPPQFRHR